MLKAQVGPHNGMKSWTKKYSDWMYIGKNIPSKPCNLQDLEVEVGLANRYIKNKDVRLSVKQPILFFSLRSMEDICVKFHIMKYALGNKALCA